ncbi:MAG: hypothetical protein RIS70_3605 [Planctomycetota bacterium]|jgi:peptidoglycan/LPS O-acetylase OafA/YrhL
MSSPSIDLPPLRQSPRYQSLEMWRGIACLFVVVFHAGYYTPYYQSLEHGAPYAVETGMLGAIAHGLQRLGSELWIGVPMFFVISGYCIMASIDSSRRQQSSTASYFLRRFRRIYPPYWIALAGTALIVFCAEACGWSWFSDEPLLVHFPRSLHVDNWIGSLLLIESWRHHVWGPSQNYVLGVAWTLCYEEQFYALAGVILWLMPRRIFTGAILITVVAISLRIACYALNLRTDGLFWNGRWLQFVAGILLYYRINYASATRQRWIDLGLFAGCIIAAAFRHLLPEPVDRSTVLAFGFAWFLGVTHRWDASLIRCAALRPLFAVGTICYSLYLTHWVVTKIIAQSAWQQGITGSWENLLFTIPLATAASIPVAICFHRWVERPCMNTSSGRTRPISWTELSRAGSAS